MNVWTTADVNNLFSSDLNFYWNKKKMNEYYWRLVLRQMNKTEE